MRFFEKQKNIWAAGILAVVITAWFSIGYHHPDEHYQIFEFAKFKLGESPEADLPWEYHEKMRPGLQPFLTYCGILFLRFFGLDDPFVIAAIFRLFAGLLSLALFGAWIRLLGPSLRDGGRMFVLTSLFLWTMPYLHVRYSSENLSAIFFFGGLLWLYPGVSPKKGLQIGWAGFILCLSFFFRYQIAFAGLGLGAWLLYYRVLSLRQWGYLLAGALLAFVPGLAADWWLYGQWTPTPYHYFVQNIVEDKAAGFGVSPWWAYLTELPLAFLPPISLFLFVWMGLGVSRSANHVLLWCLLPFVICHSLIAHKEVRFMFPMLLPMFYLAAVGMDATVGRHGWRKWLLGAWRVSLGVNIIALVFRCLYPANDIFTYVRFMREFGEQHAGTTVYMVEKDRHKKHLVPHFYQTPWYKTVSLEGFEQLNDTSQYRLAGYDLLLCKSSTLGFSPQGFDLKKVYQWFPDWLLQHNLNGWQDRTRIWRIYQVQR